MSQTVESLSDLETYRAGRAHIFRSPQSLKWFLRQHREELTKAGALLIVARRQMLDPVKTDAVVLQIGQRQAGKVAA